MVGLTGVVLAERYFQHTFGNGLTLLGEKMPGMQSAAMTFVVAAGAATDPVDRCGIVDGAFVWSGGAGKRDNKTLTDYLDSLGLQRGSSVGIHHTRFSCAAVASKVVEALGAYADIVRRPQMPEPGFEAARDLALQALAGIDDEPRQKLMVKLREWFLPCAVWAESDGGEGTPGEADAAALQGGFPGAVPPGGAILRWRGISILCRFGKKWKSILGIGRRSRGRRSADATAGEFAA